MNDQTRTLGAQPQGEREACDVAFAAWYDTQAHQLSNEQVCRVIWRRAWETSRASLRASPAVPVAQDEREALIREMCEAMRPFAARHNEWRGWPGTWAFANAALSVIERRASLSASTPSAVSAEALLKEAREQLDRCVGLGYEADQQRQATIARIDAAMAPPADNKENGK